MKVEELLQRYVQRQAERGRSLLTLDNYRRNLGRAVALWGPELDCHQVTYQHCQQFCDLDPRRAASTRSEDAILLRQWLAWAHGEGFLWRNPAQSLRVHCVRPALGAVPGLEQVQQMLAATDPKSLAGRRDALLLELLYGTGVRRAELVALNWTHWQPDQAGLWIDHGKGAKPRLQPVGPRLAQHLESYLREVRPKLASTEDEMALLLDDTGKRFPGHRLGPCIRRYCAQAQVPAMTPQSLRRAFATHLLLGGAALHEVQLLLGHSSPDVTERYTKLEVMDLLREYRRTHPRGGPRRIPRRAKALVPGDA